MYAGKLVGLSALHQDLLARLKRVAQTDAEILITGPSGVGKELYARYAHASSRRAAASFVAVNCENLSAELLENEIFGHVRGAYTGANLDGAGLAAAAEGGTLFFDEVDCLPRASQDISGGIALGEYASRLLGFARVSIERVLRRHFTSVQPNAPLVIADNDIQVIGPEMQGEPTPPAPEPPIQTAPLNTAVVPVREVNPVLPEPRRSLANGVPVPIHLVNTLLLAIILVLLVMQLALGS